MTRGFLFMTFVVCVGARTASSQHSSGSFGPIVLHTLPSPVGNLLGVARDPDGSELLLVSSLNGRSVLSFRIARNASAVLIDSLTPPFPFRALLVNGSGILGRSNVLLLRIDSLMLYELGTNGRNSWFLKKLAPVDRIPTSVHIEDLNGDGLADLLLFDDQEPGILPVFQTKKGGWRLGRIIVPDLPVGQLAPVHLNNDGLMDILAYDWVRSELHLIYGVGKERFLDQGGFAVEGTVSAIFVDPVNPYHPLRVTLFDKDRLGLVYFEMDDRGDLVEVSRQVVSDSIRNVYAVRDDSTFTSTFVLAGDSFIGLIRDAFIAQSPTTSVVGLPGKATTTLFNGDLSVSMILNARVYARLWSFGGDWPRNDSTVLAIPPGPVAAIVRDQNGDGFDDLAFISGRNGTISFVWGHADGSFSGVEEFIGPPSPRTAIGQTLQTAISRFYSTHDTPSSLNVTEIDWRDFSVTTSRIPVQGVTELIGEMRTATGATTVSAIHRLSDRTVTFATYERIRQDSFLEQTLNLGPPSVLFGASVGFVDADSIPDAILIYRKDDSSAVTLNISYGDTLSAERRRPFARRLPVMDPRVTYVWQTDANRDSLPDIIAVFPRTAREIYLLLSIPDSLYAVTVLVDSLVSLEERQHFMVYDVNEDSLPDLFAIIRGRGGLGWWKNLGGGTFAPWERIVAAPDISAFGFGRLYHPTGNDLVITRRHLNGAVVYDRARLPWGRR